MNLRFAFTVATSSIRTFAMGWGSRGRSSSLSCRCHPGCRWRSSSLSCRCHPGCRWRSSSSSCSCHPGYRGRSSTLSCRCHHGCWWRRSSAATGILKKKKMTRNVTRDITQFRGKQACQKFENRYAWIV